MNPGLVIVVLAGLGFALILVFIAILKAKLDSNSPPNSWAGKVRGFQNQMETGSWRIKMIPWDDSSMPMRIDSSGFLGAVPILGALGFFAGLGIAAYDNPKHLWIGLMVAVCSWLAALGGWWLKNRTVRLKWDVAPGRCVDRELQKIPALRGGQWNWCWRFVCEYEYLGIIYRVTPEMYWMGLPSEEAAREFLAKRISPDGKCLLRVDPKNPLRTELLELGIQNEV